MLASTEIYLLYMYIYIDYLKFERALTSMISCYCLV